MQNYVFHTVFLLSTVGVIVCSTAPNESSGPAPAQSEDDPPEGYYAFIESPNAEPPQVRPPPYTHAPVDCRNDDVKGGAHVSPFNLCGDLNRGTIPRNPMGQNVLDSPYPFELIRNMTLKYLSRTLPILKSDETIPKVAHIQDDYISQNTIGQGPSSERVRREVAPRQARKFCDQGGILCMLYKAINGESYSSSPPTHVHHPHHHTAHHLVAERREEPAPPPPRYEGPPTPCPAKVEYATPVFAKNYQGVWRYVVQIPYEGYFTQTVEVTRCVQARCHYLDGGCLASPRWTSLLVAEIFYPETVVNHIEGATGAKTSPTSAPPPSVQDFQNYQQYLHKRAGLQQQGGGQGVDTGAPAQSTTKPPHCDGVDALGCFQVRLYYDWFLVPGSCKCWRPDYFNKYVRRKTATVDL